MKRPPTPSLMTNDALLDEIVDTVRAGRSHGTWDRARLRALSTEAQKRGLIEPKKNIELQQP